MKKKFPYTIFNSRFYVMKQLHKEIKHVIQQYVPEKVMVLDYGCGNSPYRSFFGEKIQKYSAADIAENTLAEIHLDSKGRVPLENNTFDVVLSTQVLEHVDSPSLYLTEVGRLLKKDGILILTTHGYWLYHPTPTDYWRWTSAGLKKICNDHGFEIIYFKGILNRSAVGIQLFQDGLLFKLPKFILPIFCFFMQIGIIIFDKLSSNNTRDADACNYVIVAKYK